MVPALSTFGLPEARFAWALWRERVLEETFGGLVEGTLFGVNGKGRPKRTAHVGGIGVPTLGMPRGTGSFSLSGYVGRKVNLGALDGCFEQLPSCLE